MAMHDSTRAMETRACRFPRHAETETRACRFPAASVGTLLERCTQTRRSCDDGAHASTRMIEF